MQKIKDAYDCILVDCPPTFSTFLKSGILASDYYVVPVKPDPLSVLGVALLESVIKYYTDNHGKEIESKGIIFTMVRDTNMMKEETSALKKASVGVRYIFDTTQKIVHIILRLLRSTYHYSKYVMPVTMDMIET